MKSYTLKAFMFLVVFGAALAHAQVVTSAQTRIITSPTQSASSTSIKLISNPARTIIGNQAVISWQTASSSACVGSWASDRVSPSGSFKTEKLTASRSYSLSCQSADGKKESKTIFLSVTNVARPEIMTTPPKPVIIRAATTSKIAQPSSTPFIAISGQANTISQGASTVIAWSIDGISPSLCKTNWSSVTPTQTGTLNTGALNQNQSYSIVCTSSTGNVYQKVAGINVKEFNVKISATQNEILEGNSTNVSFTSTGATSCANSWSSLAETFGSFQTPVLTTDKVYSVSCKGLGISKSAEVSVKVNPNNSKPVINSSTLAIIVNTNDPDSQAIADYYAKKRNIPTSNIIKVSLPYTENISVADFEKASATLRASLPSNIQAFALAWSKPYRVECNGITSAFAYGYSASRCSGGFSNPYANSDSRSPWTDFKVRPSMMLAGHTVSDVYKMIDNGVASDATYPKGLGHVMKTSDATRSLRANVLINNPTKLGTVISPNINLSVTKAESLADAKDIMFYFQALVSVPKLETLTPIKGSVADTLTSYSGMLTNAASAGQMSALDFIKAGFTGSYGTVVEPYAIESKFSNPVTMITRYTKGETLLESYWKSVPWNTQGVFVGDPLARPYASN